MKIDDKKLWKSFNAWYMAVHEKKCPTCGHIECEIEWEDQKKKIIELINKQLKDKQ